MPTATQKDEDLLIISEDASDSGSDEITFSFDEEDTKATETSQSDETSLGVQEETQTPNPVSISADDIEKKESSQKEAISQKVSEDSGAASREANTQDSSGENDLEFSFDIDDSKSPEDTSGSDEQEVVSESENKEDDTGFSLDFSSTNDQAETSETAQGNQEVSEQSNSEPQVESDDIHSGDSQSMNDILDATIAQLQARKQSIADEKSSKQSSITHIEEKISELQSEASDLKGELKHLETEDEKISANIAKLKEMKLDPVKEHNAKRVVKK